MSRVVFTFGRFNPPTIGHQKLIEAVANIAKGDDYKIFTSHSQDPKKNPLTSLQKVEYMKKMFPVHASSIEYNTELKTPINVLQYLQGTYQHVVMVVGSDRVPSFDQMLSKYNGVEYTFRTIQVVSAGERDPDADGATGMSASKMRAAASELDTKSFRLGIPQTLSNEDTAKLMLAVRNGMGLK